ncbi:MAG: cysteine desulfurase NifS [Oscillospiraceae bacterium]|nr:cysteine desulfurase NifS [Oscillospiraceae bacterium]MDD4546704.1 cysteine desulfurase NifS [Oscillospiraceae bacterium]
MDRFIYADNAATTRLLPQVLNKMMPYLTEQYGNPSSLYSFGQTARQAVDEARDTVAEYLNCRSDEVFFTSGGSEADNWAIRMAAHAMAKKGKKHIISTAFEHHAVLHTLKALKKQGFEITLLPVYENGIVQIDDLKQAIRPDTALVTVMFANNEIGTIQPISEIGAVCREKGVFFHTDAVQAVGHIPVDFAGLNIDMLSLAAHKFHGPKGVGALIIRKGLRFANLIEGGAQEKGRRAGTENTAGIVGLAEALKLACLDMEKATPPMIAKRDRLISGLLGSVERSRLNGDPIKRLPGNVNISFEGIEGESLLLLLDFKGVCASSGSACTSGSLDPSHVLLSIGLPHAIAHGSLRLSLSQDITDEDIDTLLEVIPPIINRLRDISPLWEKILKNEKYE